MYNLKSINDNLEEKFNQLLNTNINYNIINKINRNLPNKNNNITKYVEQPKKVYNSTKESNLNSNELNYNNFKSELSYNYLKKKNSNSFNKLINAFKEKIENNNKINYYSNTKLDDSNLIINNYVYTSNKNTDTDIELKYDSRNKEFILPNDILNEPDKIKLLRILSILDTMDINLDNKSFNQFYKNYNVFINQKFNNLSNNKNFDILNPPILEIDNTLNNTYYPVLPNYNYKIKKNCKNSTISYIKDPPNFY